MGSIIFNFIYDQFGAEHIISIFYVTNFILAAITYKLGFARKLPLLKSVFVYIMLAIGTIILTIFSLVRFPITEVLIIMVVVLGIYRFRLHREREVVSSDK